MDFFGFSIVIANLNSGKYLRDALNSIIMQNYPNYEIIIMDGGSTDNSIEIINEFTAYISYWQSRPDKGQSDAFNQGFARATKEWLFWLNADDFLLKDSLFRLNNKMHHYKNCRWFVFDECVVDEKGICKNVKYTPQWNNFFMSKLGPMVPSQTCIFKKELFNKTKGFDLTLYWAMDNDMWLQFYNLGEKYINVHEYLYAFRINDDSKTFSNGYKTERSEERHRQTQYLLRKNHFVVQYQYLRLWQLIKLFTVSLNRILNNIRFRNKNLIWW